MRVQELFDLTGKVAIVTGGGSGLGRQMAEALAEAGADLVLCARKVERCEEVAAEVEKLGRRALALSCDVRDPAQVEEVVRLARDELGRIDILVNNAGTSWGASPEDVPLEGWQKVMDVNLTGLFRFTQLAGRVMIEQGGGKIVNVASVAAFGGAPPELMDAVAYSASKGGVVLLTKSAALELGPDIRVNAICPGVIDTPMPFSGLAGLPSEESAAILREWETMHVAGRLGRPEEVIAAAVFLASDEASFVTGSAMTVDSGVTAR